MEALVRKMISTKIDSTASAPFDARPSVAVKIYVQTSLWSRYRQPSNESCYLANKPLSAAGISEDNAQG